jgi:hypothetical protein
VQKDASFTPGPPIRTRSSSSSSSLDVVIIVLVVAGDKNDS